MWRQIIKHTTHTPIGVPLGSINKNNNTYSSLQPYPRWANDHAVPVGQSHVVVVHQAPTDRTVPATFLSILQLFQEAKISRN